MGMRFLLLLVAGAFPALATAGEIPQNAKVAAVIDGDTLALESGERVRLLDINTTEIAHNGEAAQEGSAEGKKALTDLVLGKQVRLEYGPRERDVYRRLLAHIYLSDGTWVNAALVKQGWAHVYTFPDNQLHGDALLPLENIARASKSGIWALPRWKIIDAEVCCKDEEIGRFELVRGKVIKVIPVDGRVYLNFGRDWKTDFTVMIGKKDVKRFKKQKIDPESYLGKTVLVRGFTAPVNGVMIRVTHPQQLEVLH